MKYFKILLEKFNQKPWEFSCAIAGMLIAILLLFVQLWKIIFVVALTLIGYWIGKVFGKNKELFKKFLDRILPRNF